MNRMLCLICAALLAAACDDHRPDKEKVPKPKAGVSLSAPAAIHPGSAGSLRR